MLKIIYIVSNWHCVKICRILSNDLKFYGIKNSFQLKSVKVSNNISTFSRTLQDSNKVRVAVTIFNYVICSQVNTTTILQVHAKVASLHTSASVVQLHRYRVAKALIKKVQTKAFAFLALAVSNIDLRWLLIIYSWCSTCFLYNSIVV